MPGLRPATLAASLLLAMQGPAAIAQDELSFPGVGSGEWEGLVDFAGFLSIDHVADDGSFTTKLSDVIDATTITLGFRVDELGQVDGMMSVDLTWFDESAGTAPTTLDPFYVVSDHHQTGVLDLSGTASRLVATGALSHETNTVASGDRVEEVSGVESRDVEWIFAASEVSCARVAARLVEASGISLLGSALLPRDSSGSGSTYHSELVAPLLAWPKTQVPTSIQSAIEAVVDGFDALRMQEYPMAGHLDALVDAWDGLHAALATLDECEALPEESVPVARRSWLIAALRSALDTALENGDHYDAAGLIDLWATGAAEDALFGDLIITFLDLFDAKLDAAIAEADIGTISDVLAFASVYGYPDLHDRAATALSQAG